MALNQSANNSSQNHVFENVVSIVIPTIFGFVICIGLIGNLVVLLVISINKQMRNSTNSLVFSLAIADIVFLALCVPFTAVLYITKRWVFADWWCPILNYLQFCSAYVSVWTLALLGLDRFLAIVYPLQSRNFRTASTATMVLAVFWLATFSACLPILWQIKVYHYDFDGLPRSICLYYDFMNGTAKVSEVHAFYFTFNFFGFLFPLTITSIMYLALLRKLWQMSRPGAVSAGASRGRMEAKKKITIMSAAIVITFTICWFPFNLYFAMIAVAYKNPKWSNVQGMVVFQMFAQVLAYTNACINPILYAFLSESFRSGFVKACCILSMWCHCKTSSWSAESYLNRTLRTTKSSQTSAARKSHFAVETKLKGGAKLLTGQTGNRPSTSDRANEVHFRNEAEMPAHMNECDASVNGINCQRFQFTENESDSFL